MPAGMRTDVEHRVAGHNPTPVVLLENPLEIKFDDAAIRKMLQVLQALLEGFCRICHLLGVVARHLSMRLGTCLLATHVFGRRQAALAASIAAAASAALGKQRMNDAPRGVTSGRTLRWQFIQPKAMLGRPPKPRSPSGAQRGSLSPGVARKGG